MNSSLVALAGSPNTGKTALFNGLTRSRQRVANYAGVTVEKKEGSVTTASGKTIRIIDLPGTYSLNPRSLDERIALDILLDKNFDVGAPQAILCVADATNLERSLSFVLELKRLGKPLLLALNMMDLAKQRGLELDLEVLSEQLGVPVIPTVATKNQGIPFLLQRLEALLESPTENTVRNWQPCNGSEIRARFDEVDRILKLSTRRGKGPSVWTERLDAIALHPIGGYLLLLALMALVFQAVFTWAEPAMDLIEMGVGSFATWLGTALPDNQLKSFLIDGGVAGVGSVIVFLPQILLLFFFILVLEDSGYMARAAFMMDKLMGKVGLNGKAFLPLLSSFACAIPGIMATRTIPERRDRLATILIAPLMTCSARLPVYALLIAAFIPNTLVAGPFRLQGLVMFGLYIASIPAALLVAWIFRKLSLGYPTGHFLLELPTYKIPSWRNLVFGLKERAVVFLKRAGTIILFCALLLWGLSTFPKAPADATIPAINYSYAGKLGHALEPILRPLGFDWRIGTAMIPGFAAREVMVGALATVFAVEEKDEEATQMVLSERLAGLWGLPTALALLVWYIFSPQCLSTFAVARRETNSWHWPALMFTYMLCLAYLGAFITFQLSTYLMT